MFQNLKHKSGRSSRYKNIPNAGVGTVTGFHSNPRSSTNASQTTAPIKGNEADRLVRCKICGFPCDKERDVKSKEGSWAGLGVSQGVQLTAGTSIGDRRVPAAGNISQSPDNYYNRSVVGGCPCCGSLVYDS